MSSVPERRKRGSGRALAVAATLLAPVALYAIIRTAAIAVSPAAGVALPPTDYTPLLRQLLPALTDPRVPLSDQFLAMARSSAASSPMAFEPLFVLGRKAADEGHFGEAIQMMEEARRRRANFLPTRLLLMTYYGRAGRYRDAVAEMDYALGSNEQVRTLILPELVKLMKNAEARGALAEVLATSPAWRKEFAIVAQNRELPVDQARDLFEAVRAARPKDGVLPERNLYLQALVRSGEAVKARALWLQSYPAAEQARHRFIFDGAFSGATATEPFGWRFYDVDVGRAEIDKTSRPPHLEVNYFGGKPTLLAEQTVALSPGRYRFTFNARSEEAVTSGALYWTVSCLSGGREAARLAIRAPQPGYRPYDGEVTIPAGCQGQKVQLVAEPGDIAAVLNVEISNLRVSAQ